MSLRTLLFLRKDNQVLLALKKRGFGEGLMNGVGGTLEMGESVEAAMVRECQEEIGVDLIRYELVAQLDFLEYEHGELNQTRVYVYISNEWTGEPKESEEMAPEWVDIDSIPYNKMWESDQYWLPEVLAGKKIHGSFTSDKRGELVGREVRDVKTVSTEVAPS